MQLRFETQRRIRQVRQRFGSLVVVDVEIRNLFDFDVHLSDPPPRWVWLIVGAICGTALALWYTVVDGKSDMLVKLMQFLVELIDRFIRR